MKILFTACNNFGGNAFSGGDRIFTEFIRYWQKTEYVTLLGSQEAFDLTKLAGINHTDFIMADTKEKLPTNYGSLWFILYNTISRTIKGLCCVNANIKLLREYDVVYSVSDFYPDLLPALMLKSRSKKTKWIAGYYLIAPFPISSHSPYKGFERLRGTLYWLMQRISLLLVKKFADMVFVTSYPDQSTFVNSRRPESRVIIVRGGVDTIAANRYIHDTDAGRSSEPRYAACFVGRFHPQKGVVGLVDIWKKVVESLPSARLAMIGNGPLEADVKRQINMQGLQDSIELFGFLDGEPKYEIFKQSRIVVHPATYDSGGMAAAEAMAWGLPGVAYDLEALKTYYPQGMLKVSPGNKWAFASAILNLLNDKALRDRLSKEARDLILNEWVWHKRAADILGSIKRELSEEGESN